MSTRTLPPDAVFTGSSPEFDLENLPDALRSEHRTAVGVYGRLVVLAGTMTFVRATGDRVPLRQGDALVIEPQELHHVEPGDGMRFRIDFHRLERSCS